MVLLAAPDCHKADLPLPYAFARLARWADNAADGRWGKARRELLPSALLGKLSERRVLPRRPSAAGGRSYARSTMSGKARVTVVPAPCSDSSHTPTPIFSQSSRTR